MIDEQTATEMEKLEAWNGQNWLDIIRTHRTWYEDNEKRDFDDALKMYQGRMVPDNLRSKQQRVQFNMLFAVVESANTSMLPTNIRFTVDEVDNTIEWTPPDVEKDLERMARRGNWRGEYVYALTDAVLYGRYWFKVTLAERTAQVRSVRAGNVYFDLTARRPEDLGYVIECIPRTPEDIQKMGKKGRVHLPQKYTGPQGLRELRALATNYPMHISEAANKTAGTRWIMTYEVTDIKNKEVSTWMEGHDRPIQIVDGDRFWNPWLVGNLNNNGQDLRGLSEVQLIKDVILAVNQLLGYIIDNVRRMVPVTMYASDKVDSEQVSVLATAEPGEYVAVNTKGASIKDVFAAAPMPEVPTEVTQLMMKLESIVSYVSALSDTARGQTIGAKTATELALIESQNRTRLQSRTNAFQSVLSKAAARALMLAMELPYEKLLDVEEAIHLIASNAIEQSRAVLQEKFMQIVAYITQRPESFNLAELDRMFVDVFGAPASLLLSDEEKAALTAQAQPEQGAGLPTEIPAGPPPATDSAAVPPMVATGKVDFSEQSPAQEAT